MNENIYYREGKVRFQVGNAFYNPESKLVRDLGVLAATVQKRDFGSLRVLDVMGGCGVRSLRYLSEAKADFVWINEGNPDNNQIIQQNLKAYLESDRLYLTHQDAHRVFFGCYDRRDYYDLLDVDCFGSGMPYLSTMLWATKIGGLMYLTSTDGRTLTGHPPEKSVQTYGAISRSHPAKQEQALRLLIGATQQQAATMGMGIEPIFSLFVGKTYRLMMRLTAKPQITADNYGFLAYCHNCGNYQTITWRKLNQINCACKNPRVTVSGAMWLGKLHSARAIASYLDLASEWGWQDIADLLYLMAGEINLPPYYYTLGAIGKFGKINLPKRSQLIHALQKHGYQSAATHIDLQGIKTNAKMETIIGLFA